MVKQVEFFFDIVSPASYLAWTQMSKLEKEANAIIKYRPFFLPGLFKSAGSSSPIEVPSKSKWLFEDLNLWASQYNVPFNMNDRFPNSSLYAMRGLIAFQDTPHIKPLGDGFYKAMWVDNEDINDAKTVQKIVEIAGIDFNTYQTKANSDENKQRVFKITEEAKNRGAFGAPTFFVGDKMFWGQDRLHFVRSALT